MTIGEHQAEQHGLRSGLRLHARTATAARADPAIATSSQDTEPDAASTVGDPIS
jgi:hypothetical protein